jgi:hypothetical protein
VLVIEHAATAACRQLPLANDRLCQAVDLCLGSIHLSTTVLDALLQLHQQLLLLLHELRLPHTLRH